MSLSNLFSTFTFRIATQVQQLHTPVPNWPTYSQPQREIEPYLLTVYMQLKKVDCLASHCIEQKYLFFYISKVIHKSEI